MQTGRVNRDGVPSTCQTPKSCPQVLDSDPRRYDSYNFTNQGSQSACYTVSLDAGSCVGGSFLFSTAYLTSFNPSNLCTNYLADIGASPNPSGSYSFTVPAGATFVVVVHTTDVDALCPAYTLSVTSCQCTMTFTDVQPAEYFYEAVRYMYCNGIISGYSDNTFRPYNNTTRGQLAKIVVLAERWQLLNPPNPRFTDVPNTNPFYQYIETAAARGIISGYADGTFRPGNDVTRGQLCKIVVLAEGWAIYTPPSPTFSDVPANNPFYQHIETAYSRGIISGYADGTFKPGNNATRGQIAKIVYNAISQR
jgi:hypothetical protein